MQTLAHLGAAVIYLHAAVSINQHKCASLIKQGRCERDPELHRSDRDPTLAMHVIGIETVDGRAAFLEGARLLELRPDVLNAVRVFHRLAVMRNVALAIEVAFAHHIRRQPQPARCLIHDVFNHQHPLRAAESPERRL